MDLSPTNRHNDPESRVVFISPNPIDDFLGYSIRPAEIMSALGRRGVEVHLLTPFPSRLPGVYNHLLERSVFSRVGLDKLVYLLGRRIVKSNGLSRLVLNPRMIRSLWRSLAKSAEPLVRGIEPDVIVGEQDLAAMASVSLGEDLDIPVFADLHDVWPLEETFSGRACRGDSTWETLSELDREIVSRADRTILVGLEMKRVLENTLSVGVEKPIILPNASSSKSIPKIQKNPGGMVYAGNLERWECVDLVIEAAARIHRDFSVNLAIVGRGDQTKHLERMAGKMGLPGSVKGALPRSEVFSFISHFDVGLVSTNKPYALPIKFFDYMSVGLPVISVDGSWADIIRRERVGMVCSPDRVSMAEAMETMLYDGVDLEGMGERGVAAVGERYNWDAAVCDLVEETKKRAS